MKGKNKMTYITIVILAYIFGAVTVHYKLFPYKQMLDYRKQMSKKNEDMNNKYLKNEKYHIDTGLYNIYKEKQADIVMLGDSLTKRVNWSELLNIRIINRGIDGDITEGYLHRMESIYMLHPKKVFLNGGTNDIFKGYSVENIFENYKELIHLLEERKIQPYVQSVIYTRYAPFNKKIKALNTLLKEYCNEKNVPFINLNLKLSKDDMLIEKYTLDGSHLSAEGYIQWKEQIKPYIQ